MVEIRIPGLDHSFSGEGEWVETENYHGLSKYADCVKRLNSKRKAPRVRPQEGDQLPLGEDMAP